MRFQFAEVGRRIKELRAGQSITVACPEECKASSFQQRIRVYVSRFNIDYGTRLSVSWIRDERVIRITHPGTVVGNGLSAMAEVTLREMWAGRVSPEGRDLLKSEFQALLNTYKEKLEVQSKPVNIPVEVDDLAERKAKAAEFLARITPKMHGPAGEDDEDDAPIPTHMPAPMVIPQPIPDDEDIEF